MADQSDLPASGYSNCVDERVFAFVLDRETRQAVRLGYSVSVLCLAPDIAHDVADQKVLRTLAQAAARGVRASDVVSTVTRNGGTAVVLLLVDADPEALPIIFERLRPELEACLPPYDGPGGQLIWSIGGSCYPRTVTRPRDLLPQAFELMVGARRAARERFSLLS